MKLPRHFLPCAGLLAALFALPLRAADAPSPAEAKLRDTLRTTLLQLRDAQTATTTLQADNATLTDDKKALTARADALQKRLVADKAAADKAAEALTAKLTGDAAEITRLKDALAKSEAALKDSVADAQAKEAARAKLAADAIVLQRLVDDREAKNRALFRLGNEILTRYEKFSLGEALAAREPFVGLTRVKLENLVQDYQDKLSDQRVSDQPAKP